LARGIYSSEAKAEKSGRGDASTSGTGDLRILLTTLFLKDMLSL